LSTAEVFTESVIGNDSAEGKFDLPSAEALLLWAAESIHVDLRKLDRDRWWGLQQADVRKRAQIKACGYGSEFLRSAQAPGIRCAMRATWHRQPGRRLSKACVEVEFCLTPGYTPEGIAQFRELPTLEHTRHVFWSHAKPVKLYIYLRHSPAYLCNEERIKQKASEIRVRRAAEKWRFDRSKPDPMTPWMRDFLNPNVKADREVMARRERRETPFGRTEYFDPKEQRPEDMCFRLRLILLQEDMIPANEAESLLQSQIDYLLKQFRIRRYVWMVSEGHTSRSEKAMRDLKRQAAENIAYQVITKFRYSFTEAEDWRALKKYIKRTIHTVLKENASELQPPHTVKPEQLIDLVSEKSLGRVYPLSWVAEEFEVSERTVRRWMDQNGYVKAPSGTRALAEEQLEAFKRDQMGKVARQLLKAHGFLPEAARKKVQRWQKEGLSAEEIVDRARDAYPQRNSQG
jgi:hypothetical protein